METASADACLDINFPHELGKRFSSAPLNEVLWKFVRFVPDFVTCDSCFLYILEGNVLVRVETELANANVSAMLQKT